MPLLEVTPVALTSWRMVVYSIIVLQWGTTISGILYKILLKSMKILLFLYLMMGWLVISLIPATVTKTDRFFGTYACWRIVIHGWRR